MNSGIFQTMFSWLLVLVVLMAGGGNGGKRRRSSAQQPEEDAGSEYNPGDDSDRDSNDEDMEEVATETRSKKKEHARGKGQSSGKGKEREKSKSIEHMDETGIPHTYVRGRDRTGGISMHGDESPPRASEAQIDPKRDRMYASKKCVGERHVAVVNLCEKVPGFRALYEQGNLHEICDFPEKTGYGIELVREFYMRAGHLTDSDGGPYSFTISVRGVQMLISPDIVGNVLETPVWTGGVDYMHAGFDQGEDWIRVMTALCVPGAVDNVSSIMSKHLRLEYRFLNFVICYNIMPLANTKVIRWDRVLFMYFVGRPDIVAEKGINLNIPFIIWKRMAREIKTASRKSLLPFPLLIMRILRLHNVPVDCPSYERPLGPINEGTLAKSHIQLHPHSPPQQEAAAPPSPPPAGSDTEASISSVYREQQRLSGELAEMRQDMAKLKRRQGRFSQYFRLLCSKLGCTSSEMPPPDTDSE